MQSDIERVLISQQQIATRVREMAMQINADLLPTFKEHPSSVLGAIVSLAMRDVRGK